MDHVMDLASEISESSSLVSEDLRTLDGSVDGEPRADGLYEERFRVDRRKLESMLLGQLISTLNMDAVVQFDQCNLKWNRKTGIKFRGDVKFQIVTSSLECYIA